VTFNLKDFPEAVLAPFGIEAQHPDMFLTLLSGSFPLQVLAGVRDCLARLTRPPITAATYLNTMRRIGLPQTAAFLNDNLAQWSRT
jgi:hypothetical protein